MLYRLTPSAQVAWTNFPGGKSFRDAVELDVDFDRLEWQRSDSRAFSSDLLRIALRHGVRSGSGVILSGMHATVLGSADDIKLAQQQVDEHQAQIRQQSRAGMESQMPGRAKADKELDDQIRASTERAAQKAEADLAKELAAPVNQVLAEHWVRLGGQLPD